MMNLSVGGKMMTFMCDSGVCRTAIKRCEMPIGLKLSACVLNIKSASGHEIPEPFTEPVITQDPKTGKQCNQEKILFQ